MNGPILSGLAPVNWSNGSANLAFDGNSLLSEDQVANAILAGPLVQSTLTKKNTAVFGQNITAMIGRADLVDAMFVEGKDNVMITWEGFNTMRDGVTSPAATANLLADYITRIKSVHPWRVLTFTSHKFSGTYEAMTSFYGNQLIEQYNEQLRTRYRELGLSGLIDIRLPGSPFNTADTEATTLQATGLYADSYHLNSAGYGVAAVYAQVVMRRLPRARA